MTPMSVRSLHTLTCERALLSPAHRSNMRIPWLVLSSHAYLRAPFESPTCAHLSYAEMPMSVRSSLVRTYERMFCSSIPIGYALFSCAGLPDTRMPMSARSLPTRTCQTSGCL
eukprot:scaffold9215_cov17-Tisochrysis_lutea.AAC.1